ncbi:hypothetical protein ABZZ17_09290 [Streptomyces sp. NPDC006512]|uniref:hypothetical protein n=1 Tax=Streptomyces sp. NPDC006512 TaxID=3154307 RepID=UPI0033A1725C
MSRSRQARLLARHLSDATDVGVNLIHAWGAVWSLHWEDGPAIEQMRALLDAALADNDRYGAMRDRTIHCARSISMRAWAAQAIACQRDGILARAVSEGVAQRLALGMRLPGPGCADSSDTHEVYALVSHVQERCGETPYPDRASEPGDEPLIEQLYAARTREHPGSRTLSANYMAHALLATEQAPAADKPRETNHPFKG